MHAAFEQVSDPKLLRDLWQVAFVLKTLRGTTRDYFEVRDLGQAGQDFVLDAFDEVSIIGIATEIVEREDRNRFV